MNEPSPSDFDRWEQLVLEGKDISSAAKELGFNGSSTFRRANTERHAEILQLSREIREGIANDRGEKWALADDAEPSLKLAYLKAESSKYRQGDRVSIEGSVDVRSDIAQSIDRFTAAVTAASVRAATGAGTLEPARAALGRSESPARVPVGRLASEEKPGPAAG